MNEPAQPGAQPPVLTARIFWILFALIAAAGIAIRVADSASFRGVGFDEVLYRRYVNMMDGGKQTVGVFQKNHAMQAYALTINGTGASAMPGLVDFFLQTQRPEGTECELPPTRFLYIYTSWLWKNVEFGAQPPISVAEMQSSSVGDDRSKDADRRDPALASLHHVTCFFSMLLMIAGGLCAWRMLGRGAGLGVLALMACDPLQIHFSQHALIDGFFTFWAVMCLWTTWECLRNPASVPWLTAHTACLALMVMTKENAFFVYCALAAVVIANRWLKFGTVTRRFVLLSIAGPLLGVALLVTMSGGVGPFVEVYRTLVAKAQNLAYARLTGDGPWHRYLIDLLITSPVVVCLALGSLFAFALLGNVQPQSSEAAKKDAELPPFVPSLLRGEHMRKVIGFLAVFVAAGYLIMCNVRYGMNLRYASIWELPLRIAAFAMVWELCARFGPRQWLATTVAIVALCGYEFRQYTILAMNQDPKLPQLYETVTADLLRLQKVIKNAP